MNAGGIEIPQWVLDWTGSAFVVVSLLFLFRKRMAYWHWSNASLLPYFALFVSTEQFMLAGLQASYLVFGIHGLLLWGREHARERAGRPFNERLWYAAGWVLSVAIFAYTIVMTEFVDAWSWLQFTVVAVSLVANLATTRTWTWSWPTWMTVNVGQAMLFWHLGLAGQFLLQFVLFALSVVGWRAWRAEVESSSTVPEATHALA